MRKTLLIGIGAQKAGTTWLARYLCQHPQVFMSPIKELHYFDLKDRLDAGFNRRLAEDFRRLAAKLQLNQIKGDSREFSRLTDVFARIKMIADEKEYMKFFFERSGDREIMCEITPSYSMLDRKTFDHISKIHDDVRFLFLMRNPADRFWSQIHFAERGTPDFVCSAELLLKEMNQPGYTLRGDYARTLTELFASVGRERVHLEFYEHLFSDAAMHRLCNFLQIDFRPGEPTRVYNATRKPPMEPQLRRTFIDRFHHIYSYVDELCGGQIPESWRRDMLELTQPSCDSVDGEDQSVEHDHNIHAVQ